MSNIIQTTNYDLAWFKQANELHQLQMRPAFQRNLVWTLKQKSFLIDSILNSYPVPELYMQDVTNEDGSKIYTVVDGQQRITACLEFLENQFQMDAKDSPSFANLTFDDLTIDQKKKVYSYTFVVRLLPEMSDLELREVFSRLNRNNVVLNTQELRQATYWGEFVQTMNQIAAEDYWRTLGIFTSNDVRRMLDVEYISELTIAAIHGVQNKKLTLDKYYELYEEEFPSKEETKSTFDIVLREIINIFPSINKTRWSKKTDFYTLFVLFSKKKEQLPLNNNKRTLAQEILIKFGTDVDLYVSTEKEEIVMIDDTQQLVMESAELFEINPFVIQYATNLRASSDLGARRRREEALEVILKPVFDNQ